MDLLKKIILLISLISIVVITLFFIAIVNEKAEKKASSGRISNISTYTNDTSSYYASGISDEIMINRVISKVAGSSTSQSKGIVHLKAGKYKIRNQIVLNGNIILEGEGAEKTIVQLQKGTPDLEDTGIVSIGTGANNVIIQNMTIDGNKDELKGIQESNYRWNGILANGNSITLRNLNIINTLNDGIKTMNTKGRNLIENVSLNAIPHSCLYLIDSSRFEIKNIACNDNGNSGLRMDGVSDIRVRNLTITQTLNWGIELYQGDGGAFMKNIKIEDFILKNPKSVQTNAIIIQSINHKDRLWHISNVTFKDGFIDNYWHSRGRSSGTQKYPAGGIRIMNADKITFEKIKIYNSEGDSIIATNDYLAQGKKISHLTVMNSSLLNSTGYGINDTSGNISWILRNNIISNNARGRFGRNI